MSLKRKLEELTAQCDSTWLWIYVPLSEFRSKAAARNAKYETGAMVPVVYLDRSLHLIEQ
jgi:hypothetical protein